MTLLPFDLVDPHIHQWDVLGTPRLVTPLVRLLGRFPRALDAVARVAFPRAVREFVGVTDHVRSNYLPADYAADARGIGVSAVAHVQAGWADHSELGPVRETRWLASLPFAEAGVRLGAIVGEADPSSPAFDRVLRAHREASPLFRGIRKMAAKHGDAGVHAWEARDALYTDARFLRGFERLAAHGLRFDAWVYSVQLDDVASLAARFPETPIVLDHLGTPVGAFGPVGKRTGRTAAERGRVLGAWKDALARVASHRNVHAKVSGLLMPVLGHDHPRRAVRAGAEEIADLIAPLVDHALDVFGPARCMWASNFPMDKAVADLPAIVEAYVRVIESRGEATLRAVFRDNAIDFYGMDVGQPR